MSSCDKPYFLAIALWIGFPLYREIIYFPFVFISSFRQQPKCSRWVWPLADSKDRKYHSELIDNKISLGDNKLEIPLFLEQENLYGTFLAYLTQERVKSISDSSSHIACNLKKWCWDKNQEKYIRGVQICENLRKRKTRSNVPVA